MPSKSSASQRARIQKILGKQTLHVQQVTETLIECGWSTKSLVNSVTYELGRGVKDGVFIREAHGWYRNQLPGLPRTSPHPKRLRQGELALAIWVALRSDALGAPEISDRLLAAGDLHKLQCRRIAVAICLAAHCGQGLCCFERVGYGLYKRLRKRPMLPDPKTKEKR